MVVEVVCGLGARVGMGTSEDVAQNQKAAEPGFEAQIFDAEGDEDLRSPYLPCMTSAAFLIDDLTPPWLQSDYNIQ